MSEPRPYDISKPEDIERLHRELRGYMRNCLINHGGCGGDRKGRQYAYEALENLAPYPKGEVKS